MQERVRGKPAVISSLVQPRACASALTRGRGTLGHVVGRALQGVDGGRASRCSTRAGAASETGRPAAAAGSGRGLPTRQAPVQG